MNKEIKEIIIKEDNTWSEFQPRNYHIDELHFGENFIYNKRTICENYSTHTFEWKFETAKDVYNYKRDFLRICELAKQIKKPNMFQTCSYYYLIEVIYKNGLIEEFSYYNCFTKDGMEELKDAIIKALPVNCKVYPYCIR